MLFVALALWGNAAGPARAATLADAPLAISWSAALLIALCYYLSQSAWVAGVGFWTLYRPLVGGALVGLILGDPAAGAQAGAAINLAYLGFIATGGVLPSDISLAGYLGTALVIAGGMEVSAALALTVPVGMLGYVIYQLRMNLSVVFVHLADRAAADGNMRGLFMWNVLAPQGLLLLLSAPPAFLGVYYGATWLATWLGQLPSWVMPMLDSVGSLLPALGIALGMHVLWRGVNPGFFLLGFVMLSLAEVPILAFALLIGAAAYILTASRATSADAAAQEVLDDAPETSNVETNGGPRLRRRDLLASWLNWLFFSHACYNLERMQGIGFAHAMAPILRRLYPTREALGAALRRHTAYYNSEPNVGALTNGVVAALEEARARGAAISEEAIHAAKLSLMGPASGLGDTLIQGTLAPVLLSLGIGLALQGRLTGPLLYTVLISALIWGVGWSIFLQGYRLGGPTVLGRLKQSALQRILAGAEMVGSAMLGALGARFVRVQTPLAWQVGQMTLRLQEDLLDKLLPGLLPLAIILLHVALLRRGLAPRWLMLCTVGFGAAARLLGLL